MRSGSGWSPALGRVLDALATRRGLTLLIAALVLVCVFAGQLVERSVRQMQQTHEVFRDTQLRNGFVSLSDVQRVLLITQEARMLGAFSDDRARAFSDAIDILFVRTDSFRRVLDRDEHAPVVNSAAAAIEALDRIIAIADSALADDLRDVETLWQDLLAASDAARGALVVFLDDMDRLQSAVLLEQTAAVRQQRSVVLASLGGLTFVGIAALSLLRREVLTRRARERAERDVEFLAYFDPLTRLPNRAQFQKRLKQTLDSDAPVTLMLVDLDDFKGINDTYGHATGDAALQFIADILTKRAEQADGFAARLGGDEFAVVMPGRPSATGTKVAEGVLEDVKTPLVADGETIRIGTSIGIARSADLRQDMDHTVDSLSRIADFALYASKENGRGQFTVYDKGLELRYLERRGMVDDLPRAIADGGLDIYLQPKVHLPSKTPYGFEALVRWRRGDRVVPPDEFITIAEESGLIYEIDRYVLRTASGYVAEYNRRMAAAVSVSVNLSALHFTADRIVGWVKEALDQSGLSPALLTLEITETAEMRDWGQAQKVIGFVKDLGAKISIDDFGTGYSSLAYMRSTFADEIKIDKSMVEHIETSQKARFLLDGVLDLSNNLGLEVVVEGIETDNQAAAVHAMGAGRAQGYLFGRPMPAAQALAALDPGASPEGAAPKRQGHVQRP